MTESSWTEHISYLEGEIKKIEERIAKLNEMIPTLEDVRKKTRRHRSHPEVAR